VRGGIWSGCVEVESMEVVVSEPVVQRLLDMSAVVQLALNTPTLDIEALRRTPPPPVVQLTNQSGCPLRLRVRGSDTPVLVPAGETCAVAATDALIAVEEISLMAGGAWHILPPLAAGRFGSWTVLGERRDERRAEPRPPAGAQLGAPAHRRAASSGAHLGAPSAAHHRTPSSGTGSASGGAPPVGEPVAVQCTVRAMTDDAAGVHGPGVAVVVRSLAMVHNATSTPLALQLLLPVANGSNGPNGSHDESEPTVPAPPSALDLGVDAVDGGAGGLLDDVESGDGLANQLSVGDRLERQGGQFLGRVGLCQPAFADDVGVGNFLAAGDDLSVHGRAG
jgi:hypothetical protein